MVADAFHTADGGVAVLLVNVVEFDELDVVVLANLAERLIDRLLEFGVQQRVDGSLWIAFLERVEQAGESGTEVLAILLGPVGILILAYGRVGPCVVGAAEHEYDVRVAQAVDTCDEAVA